MKLKMRNFKMKIDAVAFILSIFMCVSIVHCDIPIGVLSTDNDKYENFLYQKTVELAVTENDIPGINVSYRIEKSSCDEVTTSGKTSELLYVSNVSAVFGPRCSLCDSAIEGTAYSKKLLISHGCIDVNSNAKFPYLIRTKPFVREHGTEIARIYSIMAKKFNWNVLGIAFSTLSGWPSVKNRVETELKKRDFVVKTFAIEVYHNFQEMVHDIKENGRIVLFLCSEKDSIDILIAALDLGLYDTQQYAFITTDFDLLVLEEKQLGHQEHEIMNGLINIRARSTTDLPTQRNTEFLQQMNSSFFEEFGIYNPYDENGHVEHLYESVSYLYDAILIYLQSVRKAINDHIVPITTPPSTTSPSTTFISTNAINITTGTNVTNGSSTINNTASLVNTMSSSTTFATATTTSNTNMAADNNTNNTEMVASAPKYRHYLDVVYNTSLINEYIRTGIYDGLSGKIDIKQSGTRDPELMIVNFLRNGTQLIYDGTWNDVNIVWLGGSETAPDDQPECGFDNICPRDNTTVVLVCAVTPVVLILLLIIYKLIKLQQYENDINNKESIKSFSDVKMNVLLQGKSSMVEAIIKHGKRNEVSGIISMRVYYDGRKVMLKKLQKKAVLMTRGIMIDLKILRDLNHQNLNPCIGVISKPPVICILQEWCKKGSLYDILNNEDIQLDWVFKHEFITDILSGMIAIHDSALKLHGHLTSKNCLINHRWVVQISDYGLKEFKEIKNQKEIPIPSDDQLKYENLLWTAPENINFPHNLMTRQGDVYSFGVIVSEIINRKPPYAAFDDMRPSDIIHYVKTRCIPPFRPHVTLQSGLDPRLVDLMKTCWEEWPEDRPLFKELKPRMKPIRGDSVDTLDNMINMMERYSKDLDKTAKERTDMYKKEKIKSNQLLYRCIPKPIATELLEGNPIEPDIINPATIMIVRIHDFSDLMQWMDPAQMIDVLNDFYKMTEQVTESKKNIFKSLVDREECIFCANIPCYKKTSDAILMANVALEIAKSRRKFRWRHLGDEILRLKITLHSGPATGVVVGTKIPIYNIFGSTMDYARSLTHYTPFDKIVVTDECYQLLKENESYMWQSISDEPYNDIGLAEPRYLIGTKTMGIVFPESPKENIEEIEEEAKQEEEEADDEEKPPAAKPKLPYQNVSSKVQTAFESWFEDRKKHTLPMQPLNKVADF